MYLHEKLEKYVKKNRYPMHMPGHKRQIVGENPYGYDITEIEGYDNLHDSTGIIKSDMEQTAKIYGSAYSRYLVNGSTCGVLAAISSVTEQGDDILIARNCHKSAYHALDLKGLRANYIYPEEIPNWGIQGGILTEKVEAELEFKTDMLGGNSGFQPGAVFITSPTYEGVVSDIEGIAEVCHAHGIPLVVDEAHGAHLMTLNRYGSSYSDKFDENIYLFPRSALDLGADLVIQSLHKTMPAMTQTAILHVSKDGVESGRVSMERIDYYLNIYQSSSPSYVLMGSISNCIHWLSGDHRINGKTVVEQVSQYEEMLCRTRKRLEKNKNIHLIRKEDFKEKGFQDRAYGVASYDPGKLVLSTRGTNLTGENLASLLRKKFAIEVEMAADDYIIAMTTLFDTEEGLTRFADAIEWCDRQCEKPIVSQKNPAGVRFPKAQAEVTIQEMGRLSRHRRDEIEWIGEHKIPVLWSGTDWLSVSFIYVYPPGIPIVAPGEIITEEIAERINLCYKRGCKVVIEKT